MPLSFPLAGLVRRVIKGSRLTIAEGDGNMDVLEEALETLDSETVKTADLVSLADLPGAPTGTDEIMVMRGGVPYKELLSVVKAYLTSTAPAAFVAGNWTATAGVGQIEVNITALPADGGSAITSLQYRLDGGTPVTFGGGAGTGIRTITGLTGGVEYDVEIRAVNENGAGAWSDVKARTPTAGSSASIVTSGTSSPGFGTSRNIPVPAGAAPGDRLVVMFGAANPVTGFTDDQGTSYTAPTIASQPSDEKVYISAPLGATLPTTITVTFGSGTFIEKADVYVVRGATATVTGDSALSTGFSVDPRSHAYTTSAANDLVFGLINFEGGGVTGSTGADTDHTWRLNAANGYANRFGIVRPTAGSYGATLGPAGAGSASTGYWFRLAAA